MKKAAFSLENYFFSKVHMDINIKKNKSIQLRFDPSGIYNEDTSIFNLTFMFFAKCKGSDQHFIEIECQATYKFQDNLKLEEIPPYFYGNCIAILFPYIRSFISTVTLQANIPALIIPTMNLTELSEPLKQQTKKG